jgi:hypothetical protein
MSLPITEPYNGIEPLGPQVLRLVAYAISSGPEYLKELRTVHTMLYWLLSSNIKLKLPVHQVIQTYVIFVS